MAKGHALLHAPEVAATRLLSDDPEIEEIRLNQALKELRNGLDTLLTGSAHTLGAIPLEVLEMFSLLAQDRSWERRLIEGAKAGLTAEAAVEQVRSEHRARMNSAKDAYLRDRLHDLEELDNRLLRHLAGNNDHLNYGIKDAILVARDIGPAELLEYSHNQLKAILLEEGSSSSHAAIIARAMNIPMIGGIKGILARTASNDSVIVDAESNCAFLRYDPLVESTYDTRFKAQTVERKRLSSLKSFPNNTKNGKHIHLLMNAGLVLDLEHLGPSGAEGIGLFRTEFQFLVSNALPRVDAQTKLYSEIFERSENKPITFRTLDLGGDKIARFMPGEREENPAMGWRALRLGLDRKALLVYQIRALLRAGDKKHLRIMFPLVSTLDEFLAAKAIVLKELDWSKKHGRAGPKKLEVGAMIEAPSIAWSTRQIAKHADFLSIGTNDLMQFFFAADRGSAKVSDRYDILSRPALEFLKYVKDQAGGTPISICGEHAGRTLEAIAFIGLGFDRLSMPSSKLGSIKEMILKLDSEAAKSFLNEILCGNETMFREQLQQFAASCGITI